MPEQWEYRVETKQRTVLAGTIMTDKDMEREFNAMGAEGWELVMAQGAMLSPTQHVMSAIWKRKKLPVIQ